MSKTNKPVGRKDEIVIQEVDGEILIYDLRNNKAFCLNETSALIWHACDGSRDVTQLSSFVSERLNAPANEDLVWLALDQLKKEKLLEKFPETDGRFAGMSRREVIKKIGIGTAIAIPIVAGLVAPPAYASASVCGASFMTACTCANGTPSGNPNCGQATCTGTGCLCTGPLTSCTPSGNGCMGTCA